MVYNYFWKEKRPPTEAYLQFEEQTEDRRPHSPGGGGGGGCSQGGGLAQPLPRLAPSSRGLLQGLFLLEP